MPKKTNSGSPGTAITKWDARLAELAKLSKKASSAIGGGGNFISLKGGNLSYQGQPIPGNKMRVIVVDWILHNLWFDGAYDEENIQSPACYAFGREKAELAPDPENVPEPVSAACEGCEKNQWGSADKGRGKACAETARLALLSEADFSEEEGANIETANEAYLKVPVTSMGFWGGYVRELETAYHRPPLAFVTELSIVPQAKQPGWHLEFQRVESIEDDRALGALLKKYDQISQKIAFPYPKFEEPWVAPAPKAPARRAAAPKAPAPPAAGRRAPAAGKAVAAPKF